jgi:SAM-dependent methyltransferase
MQTMEKLPLCVSLERWQQAQEWEGAYWRAQHPDRSHVLTTPLKRLTAKVLNKLGQEADLPSVGDDWNHWWAEQFDQYRALPSRFNNAIELGSGPYTNVRVILEGRSASHLICSDPLVNEYLRFRGQWLARMWQEGKVYVDDHPLEECPFASDYFDLVVVINVLDHCRDSLACIRQAVRITKPGGFLVIGQDLSNFDDVQRIGDDIGHPIRIDHETLDNELLQVFRKVHYKILSRDEGRNPSAHYGTYVFIGQKH